jgi:aryl sulfotransferase
VTCPAFSGRFAQLIFNGDPDIYCEKLSPWLDFRLRTDGFERATAQTHRRYLKTHLPIDALVYSPKAKYLYVGRDGRDIFWSWYNHHQSFKPEALAFLSSLYPDQPAFDYPNPDIRLAFLEWLDRDAYPNWPFWSHVQGWFDARHLPNLKLVHFADLKADLPGQIREIAAFLEIDIDPRKLDVIVEYCGFDHMKRLATADEDVNRALKGGGASFIHKGTNGRWKDVLTAADNARFHAEAAKHLSLEAAAWLESGILQA